MAGNLRRGFVLRILVLGGTVFLGRHLVEAAVAAGHEVTLFNRGQSEPRVFSQLEQIHGDRDGGLAPLRDRRWDAVVDTSGRLPRLVAASVAALARAGQYLFVSSISVYRDVSSPGIRENAPAKTLSRPDSEDEGTDYGALKFLCEEEVRSAFGERATIVRPGLIVGPWDPSDRFTYWPARLDRGGDVLVPGRPDRRIQFVDGRDLAAFMLRLVEQRIPGTFNAGQPPGAVTMGTLMAACQAVAAKPSRLYWVDDAWLTQEGVGQWMELPLWINPTPDRKGFYEVDCTLAHEAGLTHRSLAETVRDTLSWHREREPHSWTQTGLATERERDLLERAP